MMMMMMVTRKKCRDDLGMAQTIFQTSDLPTSHRTHPLNHHQP